VAVVRLLVPVDVVADDGSVHAPRTAIQKTLLALLGVDTEGCSTSTAFSIGDGTMIHPSPEDERCGSTSANSAGTSPSMG
jgi:hypothetical protein